MKNFFRRFSSAAVSSPYSRLRSESASQSCNTAKHRRSAAIPAGNLPIYVGEDMERFVVKAVLLNHPVFINLLNKSAEEYGYKQQGVLHIRCSVFMFERVLEALESGKEDIVVKEFL